MGVIMCRLTGCWWHLNGEDQDNRHQALPPQPLVTIYQITLHPSLGYINQLVAPLFLAAVNSEPAAEPIKTNFYKNLPLVRRVPIFSLVTECNR